MGTTGWFEDAVEPRTVMAELTKVVPELVDGGEVLLGCKVSRIRPAEGSWRAVYELKVRDVATGVERTFTVNGVLTPPEREPPLPSLPGSVAFGADGWSCVVPSLGLRLDAVPADALPGLRVLTDPEEGRLLLEHVLREGGHLDPGSRITASVPTVVAHKSGVRAAVLCRLDYAPERGAAPSAVMAKVHCDGQGERAHAAMDALSAALGSDGPLRLPHPLAYVPELRLSLQEYVDHRGSLRELFYIALSAGDADTSAVLLDAVRATAAGLAQLHQCRTSLGDPVTWDDELATLREKHDRLMAATSTLRDGMSSMPDRLDAAARATVADPLVPAHHSFHPAQVLLTERGVAFIDFDKCCDAEPASDIALFTTKLMHMGANKVGTADTADMREQHVAAVRRAFLEEYQRRASVSAARIALWEALELSSLVLGAVKKVNREWIERCRRMLDDHLAANGW